MYRTICKLTNEFGNKVGLYFHDIIGAEFKTPFEVTPNPLLDIFCELMKHGYIKNLKDLKIKRTYSSCALNRKSFINVCPDGETTKCEHYVGRNSIFSCGNINESSSFDTNKSYDVLHDNCNKCIYFPLCSGGCLSNHMLKTNGGCIRIKNILIDLLIMYINDGE